MRYSLLQVGMTTAGERASFADISANISQFVRSYFLMTWMSHTTAVPASSVAL